MISHPLVEAAQLIYLAQPMEERQVVTHQRKTALRYFQITRAKLAGDPAATLDDLAVLDAYIRFSEQRLNQEDDRADRRRLKTRERVRRHRASKKNGSPHANDGEP